MNTKMKSLKILTAGITIFAMLFIFVIPVFAAESETNAEVAITKILRMPTGTTIPGVKFIYEFEKLALNGKMTEKEKDKMPIIPEVEIKFDAGEIGCKDDENGVKHIHKETTNFIEGMEWPAAGVYEYLLTEITETYETPKGAMYKDEMTYSNASYRVVVYVENGKTGLYVSFVGVYIIILDHPDQGKVGESVDPMPGGDPNKEHDFSKVVFTSYYLKCYGGNNPEDTVLSVGTVIDGAQGDRDKFFKFSVTVYNPATILSYNKTYKAYILDSKGNVVMDIEENVGKNQYLFDAQNRPYVEFVPGSQQIGYLKHDQFLSFINLPVGSSFDVAIPLGVERYTPKYKKALGNVTPEEKEGSIGNPLTVPTSYIAENNNKVVFTNTYKDVTQAGIRINNLPYFSIIFIFILVAMGYVSYSLNKKSKNKD